MQTRRDSFDETGDINAMLDMRRIAVVGLSSDSSRDGYRVAAYLQRAGYDIIPINPNEAEVLGEKAYASLSDLPEPPDMVDVFRRPEYVGEVVEEAIKVGAKGVWLQSGIINYEAARRAREAGLHIVMDRCMMVEHRMRET
jgi:predicted CoA-binding protein